MSGTGGTHTTLAYTTYDAEVASYEIVDGESRKSHLQTLEYATRVAEGVAKGSSARLDRGGCRRQIQIQRRDRSCKQQ
jgi:hypothetical protein